MKDLKELGPMIRYARKEKGLTQLELADKTGTTYHHISYIEKSKQVVSLKTLAKIENVLGIIYRNEELYARTFNKTTVGKCNNLSGQGYRKPEVEYDLPRSILRACI